MKIKPIYFIFFIAIVSAFFIWQHGFTSTLKPESQNIQIEQPLPDKIVEIKIAPNATYGKLMDEAGIDYQTTAAILEAAKDFYDLTSIRAERSLFLHYDPQTNKLKQLVYQIDTEEELYVVNRVSCIANRLSATSTNLPEEQDCWEVERRAIEYELREKTLQGEITSSLYQWALDNQADVRVILDLADVYQWTIDFAIDPKVGDTFKFIYQERYRNGEYKMPGKILAAKYVNSGMAYQIYSFKESEANDGYFDENGVSVQKELLKAPIQYRYISSGFTTGLRCLEYYGLCTNHRAIDYAAAAGTPIRAVGGGIVVYAGWNSQGYGNFVSIRHNETYTTNYAHQSKILVKVGQAVKQGEIIGKVGSTGLSTGPHLHYEIVKHGSKINPLTLELPPGKSIKEENKERYFQSIKTYQDILNQ